MKEKTAEIIRIITIPPIEALVMLLILYGGRREEFGTSGNLLMALLFLTVIPIASYPIASGKKIGKKIVIIKEKWHLFLILCHI